MGEKTNIQSIGIWTVRVQNMNFSRVNKYCKLQNDNFMLFKNNSF